MLRQLTFTLAVLGFMPGLCGRLTADQTAPAAVLDVDIENMVSYYLDVTDPAKLATSAVPVLAAPGRTFRWQVVLADVVAVNGVPAKGLYAGTSMPLQSAVRPPAGQAIADIGSWGLNQAYLVILQPDGTEIGSLYGMGVGGAAAPPGSPQGAAVHNMAVTGGTGAYLGARGQWSYKQALGGTGRSVSMAEDPANRRIHGGASRRDIIQLLPMSWPEVTSLPSGPAVYHAADFSPVTGQKPARAGEQLIMSVAGLGPTRPSNDPGKPFPPYEEGKLHAVTSPVDVKVNGRPAKVMNKCGWPEVTNLYRLDFEVPEGTGPGMATVAVSVAWIAAPEIKIPVQ